MRLPRNLVQSIGNGADEILHTVACGGRDGVEFEAALLREIAQCLEARAIGRGVQLGGHHNHGLFGEGFAEGSKLAVDDFKGMDRVIFVRIAGINQMNKEARTLNVTEEADAEARALVRASASASSVTLR